MSASPIPSIHGDLKSESSPTFSEQLSSSSTPTSNTPPRRVAIIGGGAGGSSAAFFLSHFAKMDSQGLKTEVILFEKEDYIGGRANIAYPWNDDVTKPVEQGEGDKFEEIPVEIGAAVFVSANKNLEKAVKEFKLEIFSGLVQDGLEDEAAFWDGETFVYRSSSPYWWDNAKLIYKYGFSPRKLKPIVQGAVNSFLQVYQTSFLQNALHPFTSLASFSRALNLDSAATMTAKCYFDSHNISPLFTSEMVACGTQVNYGTRLNDIHALGALISLACGDTRAVKGGNRQIFEEFVKRSGATVRMGEEEGRVVEIRKEDATGTEGGRAQWIVETASGDKETFDAIILAGPIHQSRINIVNSPVLSLIPQHPYVHLHVTLIMTTSPSPQPSFFNLPPGTKIPQTICCTFDTPGPSTRPKPSFNSLNYLQVLDSQLVQKVFGNGEKVKEGQKVFVVKMFSADRLSDEVVGDLLGKKLVLKIWRKEWDAYPLLSPITDGEKELAPVRVDEGFYYVNGFERLFSTMESETVASSNVVSLLLKDFFDYTTQQSWAEEKSDKGKTKSSFFRRVFFLPSIQESVKGLDLDTSG